MDNKRNTKKQDTGDTKTTSTEKSAEKEKNPVDPHFVDSKTTLYGSHHLYF